MRKIYSSWAFKEDENEKRNTNKIIYNDFEGKYKLFSSNQEPSEEDLKRYMCYKCVGTGYANKKYKILSNPHDFSVLEQALICDKGNLCFGYRIEGGLIVIHTDELNFIKY